MAHILVVGAGIVGLCVARAALRRHHAVTLIEQGSVPNPHAASFDQHRMIRLHYGASEGYTRMVREAFAAWDALWQDLGSRHFVDSGALAVSAGPGDYADQSRAMFHRLGIRHEWLNAAEIETLCPQLEVPRNAWGVYAKPGGPLFAERIVTDLACLVSERGARIVDHARVAAIDAVSATVTSADGRTLAGDVVVVAAGAWLPMLLPNEFGDLRVFRQTLCYVDPPPQHRVAWAESPAIVGLGARDVYTLPPAAGTGLKFGSGSQRRRGDPSEGFEAPLERGRQVIDDFSPYLREAHAYRPLRIQVGYYVMQESRRFTLERSGRRIVVTNCDGQMFKFGPLLAERILDAIDGERSFVDVAAWAAGDMAA
jgi:sarcosine oxidase